MCSKKDNMLKLQTQVTDEPCKVGISYDDKIMMLGSFLLYGVSDTNLMQKAKNNKGEKL